MDAEGFVPGLALTPVKDVLAVNAGAWYDPEAKALVATGKVAVTAGDLSANAAIDASKADTADLKFDFSADVTYNLFEKKDSLVLDAYYTKDGLAGNTGEENLAHHQGDLGLKFVDAGGLMAPLAFSFGLFGNDLANTSPVLLSIAQSASYMVGDSKIKPYEAFRMDLAGGKFMYLNGGIEYDGIANTIVKVDFAMGTTGNDNNTVLVAAKDDTIITISAKVTP